MNNAKICINRDELIKAFNIADAWRKPDGTVKMLDDFEDQREKILHNITIQQIEAENENHNRDDNKDALQYETVSDALEEYLYSNGNKKSVTRDSVCKEIRSTGIVIRNGGEQNRKI